MDINKAIELAKSCEENDLCFTAMKLWEKIIEREPTEYRLFRYADLLRLCGFYSKSQIIYSKINPELIPENYRYHFFLHFSQLYIDQGKWLEAKELIRKSIDCEDVSTVSYVYMASVLIHEENTDEAIDFLKIALNKAGDIDEVCYNLATKLAIKGQMGSALEFINRCLELNPDYPNAQNIQKDILEYLSISELEIDTVGPKSSVTITSLNS